MSHIEHFESHRAKLHGYIYRMTGSVSDTEDILQETYLKWQNCDPEKIHSPAAWLTTTATNLTLDFLKSAAVKRNTYIGPWLPEPLTEPHQEPDQIHELDQSITMALMVVLDKLSAYERAAFILHDIFHYNFSDVAKILGKTEANCRKLSSRSRAKVQSEYTPDVVLSEPKHRAIIDAFFDAIKSADMDQLVGLLAEDVQFHSDGGGKVIAALRILQGRERLIHLLERTLIPAFASETPISTQLKSIWLNGAPGILMLVDGKAETAFSFQISESGIEKVYAIRNPDKLKRLAAVCIMQ